MQPSPDGLFFDRVAKSFGGTRALKGVSMKVSRGEIVALLGENGAGKSTLIKILGGIYRPDDGAVMIDGHNYAHEAGTARGQKVAFIHQDLGLIEWMSVAENIALSLGYVRNGRRINWSATETAADQALKLVEAEFPASARVSSLTRTQKSLVAIARALAQDCDFLVLDEPTASLPADEVERLFSALRPLKERGVGMIYVSHRLDEIFRIADRVAVLRDGQMVGMRPIAHTTPDELVSMIVGRKAREITRPAIMDGPAILQVEGLRTPAVGPVSFSIRRGELLALAGLRGAGHEDVGRALFGVTAHAGKVTLKGVAPDLRNTRAAMRSGIGLVARDRIGESVAPGLSIRENAFLNPAALGRRMLTVMRPAREEDLTRAMGKRVGLSPNDPTLPIEALSGGNQQKVVMGRWLGSDRQLLITEDPTAGVDVGAKAEIYHLLFQALASGMGVLVVSTDFEEIANICHRAIVFSRGLPVAELSGVELSTESLIQAASAGEAA
jgi:ribose transport system ATP-binding protein